MNKELQDKVDKCKLKLTNYQEKLSEASSTINDKILSFGKYQKAM